MVEKVADGLSSTSLDNFTPFWALSALLKSEPLGLSKQVDRWLS